MTLFITINQEKAIEWKLTANEAMIIDYLLRLPSWGQRITVENNDFYWVSRSKIISDMPFITTKDDTVYRIYKSLSDKGLIEYMKLGQKDAIMILPKLQEWTKKKEYGSSEQSEINPRTSEMNPIKVGNESESKSEMNPTYSKLNNNSDIVYSKLHDRNDFSQKNLFSEFENLEISNDKKNEIRPVSRAQPTDHIVSNKKGHKIGKTALKTMYGGELEILLQVFNSTCGTKVRVYDDLLENYHYWRQIYSYEEVEQSIQNIPKHDFWNNKMTLTILFRIKNQRAENVNYISELLNLRQSSSTKNQMATAFDNAFDTVLNELKEKHG